MLLLRQYGGGIIKNLNIINKITIISLILCITIIICFFITYKLSEKNYIKKQEGSTLLEELVINGHDIKFNPEKFYYEISLNDNETSLSINAKTISKSSTINIFNNDDLTKHDKVHIYVTNKNHDTSIYTIKYTNTNANAYSYFENNIASCESINEKTCIKYFSNEYSDNYLLFTYDYMTTKGYPNTNIISINDKIVFKYKLVNAEFSNFYTLNNIVLFTYNNENEKNKMNLFAVDTNGKVLMNSSIINNKLKNLYIYNFRVKDDDIVEARYTIQFNKNKFDTPIMKSYLSAKEYKILMNIKC